MRGRWSQFLHCQDNFDALQRKKHFVLKFKVVQVQSFANFVEKSSFEFEIFQVYSGIKIEVFVNFLEILALLSSKNFHKSLWDYREIVVIGEDEVWRCFKKTLTGEKTRNPKMDYMKFPKMVKRTIVEAEKYFLEIKENLMEISVKKSYKNF